MIDVVDVTRRHSLVTLPSLLGVPAKSDLQGESAVAAAEMLEQIAQEYPNADLTKREEIPIDPAAIRSKFEEINIWEPTLDPVVEQNSKLAWHRSDEGDLVLLLPKKGENVVIWQDTIGKYMVKGTVNGTHFENKSEDEPSAILYAEMNLMLYGQDLIKALLRDKPKNAWKAAPIDFNSTMAAFLIRRLKMPKREVLKLTKGEAQGIFLKWRKDGKGTVWG